MQPLERVRRAAYELEDLLFDLRANVRTRGRIEVEELRTDSANRDHATPYHAVWCRNLRRLIGRARELGVASETFVDVGCGKGRACFYASRRRFSRVIGVDFEPRLIEAANRNKASFRHPSGGIEFVVGDAAEYLIPEGSAFVFLFNPFDAVVMRRFVENNAARFRASRSVLAYANDSQLSVLESVGMESLFREESRKISLWRFP